MSNLPLDIEKLAFDCERLGLIKEAALLRRAFTSTIPHLKDELTVIHEIALVLSAMANYEPHNIPEQVYYVSSLHYNTNGKTQRTIVGELGYALHLILKKGYGRHDVVTLDKDAREKHEVFGAELRYLIALIGAYYNSTTEEENDQLTTSELEISRGCIVSSATKMLDVLSSLESTMTVYTSKPLVSQRDLGFEKIYKTPEENVRVGLPPPLKEENLVFPESVPKQFEKAKEELAALVVALTDLKRLTERGRTHISKENLLKLIEKIRLIASYIDSANSLETELDLTPLATEWQRNRATGQQVLWTMAFRATALVNKPKNIDRSLSREQTRNAVQNFSSSLTKEQLKNWPTLKDLESESTTVEDFVRDQLKRITSEKNDLEKRFNDLERLSHKREKLGANLKTMFESMQYLFTEFREIEKLRPKLSEISKLSADQILERVEAANPEIVARFSGLSAVYNTLFVEPLKPSDIASFYNAEENKKTKLRSFVDTPSKKNLILNSCRNLLQKVEGVIKPASATAFADLEKKRKKLETFLKAFANNGLAIAPHEEEVYNALRGLVTSRSGRTELWEEDYWEGDEAKERGDWRLRVERIPPDTYGPVAEIITPLLGISFGQHGAADLAPAALDALDVLITKMQATQAWESSSTPEAMLKEFEELKSKFHKNELFESGSSTATAMAVRRFVQAADDIAKKFYQYPKEDGTSGTITVILNISKQTISIVDSENNAKYSASDIPISAGPTKLMKIEQEMSRDGHPLAKYNASEFVNWLGTHYVRPSSPDPRVPEEVVKRERTPQNALPEASTTPEEAKKTKSKEDRITNPETVHERIGLLRTFDEVRANNIDELLAGLEKELRLYESFGAKEREWYGTKWGTLVEISIETVEQLSKYLGTSKTPAPEDTAGEGVEGPSKGLTIKEKGILPVVDRFIVNLYNELDMSHTAWVTLKTRLSRPFKEIERAYTSFLGIEERLRSQANTQRDIPYSELIALVATVSIDRVAQEVDGFVEKYKE